MTARMSVRRLPPPGLAGGINGLTYAHSSSVRSLGYLRWSRLYLWRFSSVHIGGPSANQASSFESKRLTRFKKFRNGHSALHKREAPSQGDPRHQRQHPDREGELHPDRDRNRRLRGQHRQGLQSSEGLDRVVPLASLLK